jgi:chromosome partitioning protein
MTRTIAWTSEKGGSGKTTTVINTAVCLARMRKRVLVVDADPQSNATMVFLKGQDPDGPTLHHVLINTADAGDTIRATGMPGLDILPGDRTLAEVNLSLVEEMGRERRMRLAMRGVEGYDFIIVDTSPSRSLININVLNYVSEVWCPVDPGIFSLAGLVSLQGAAAEVVRYLDNAELRLAGLVLTQTRGDNLCRDVEAQLRATFGSLVCKTVIPASVKVGEAHSRYLSVLDYAPRSPAATAYAALTKEIIAHGKASRTGNRGRGSVQADSAGGETEQRRAG